jgi:EAL domain-containing protein (putative c-di-GMP-specific phosphodiesterase class I)
MKESEQRRLWLVTQLHKALELGELLLYYQPQAKVSEDKLVGLEALIRWNHRELGLVSPGEFIPLAEETGLIIPIGTWVIEEACRQAKDWQNRGLLPVRVSVNVSALQFSRDDFIDIVTQALEKSGLAPHWLELELTEGLLLGDTGAITAKLHRLKEIGVDLAIDDFGTGYSSLRYLQQFPIDTLKIDQSFVRTLGTPQETPKTKALLKTIAMLGYNLGMRVIAEGVETSQQLAYLEEIGCQEIQGYLLSRPLKVQDFEGFTRQMESRFASLKKPGPGHNLSIIDKVA